jgi:hypothetical protein
MPPPSPQAAAAVVKSVQKMPPPSPQMAAAAVAKSVQKKPIAAVPSPAISSNGGGGGGSLGLLGSYSDSDSGSD